MKIFWIKCDSLSCERIFIFVFSIIFYNFAVLPEVKELDAFWHMKKRNSGLILKEEEIEEIHMPSNSGLPFYMAVMFGITGFFLVFEWHLAAAVAAIGIVIGLIIRSFDYDEGYHVSVEEIKNIESRWRKVEGGVKHHAG
jgi:cytochrome aa3-600 menaquinol oxidase subunit I